MKTDIEIANSIEIKPIYEIADKLGIDRDLLEPYGRYKAKLPLSLIDKSKIDGKKLILVSAISPTPAGEGKTTISIGLTEGLNRIGKQATVVLREPSLGPVLESKEEPQVVVTLKSFQWKTSTCTLQVTSVLSKKLITCYPPLLTIISKVKHIL